jgi:hypothetical protein
MSMKLKVGAQTAFIRFLVAGNNKCKRGVEKLKSLALLPNQAVRMVGLVP